MGKIEDFCDQLVVKQKYCPPTPPPPPQSQLPSPPTISYPSRPHESNGSLWRGNNNNKNVTSTAAATRDIWDRLFDEAYKADVIIITDSGASIYAHASVLGVVSPVLKNMLKQSKRKTKRRTITIRGVPHDAVRVFVRFLYSSCVDPEEMEEFAIHLLVLSHSFIVPHLKKECQWYIEKRRGMLNVENVMDMFQLALLCDAPRLSLICHRMILNNFKAVSATQGWIAMKESHPILEKEILLTVTQADKRQKAKTRKANERKMYMQLYDAMEALVHICRDGCKTIGPYDMVPKKDQGPCKFTACKGLELLVRHFAACQLRVPGGCVHCKRMWQLLELHSHLCADSDLCRVPLCRKFKERSVKQSRRDQMRWKILARKILRSKSISGAPYFSLVASTL